MTTTTRRRRRQQRNCNTRSNTGGEYAEKADIYPPHSFAHLPARTCSICFNNRWQRDFLRLVNGDLGQSEIDTRVRESSADTDPPECLFLPDLLTFPVRGLFTVAGCPAMLQSISHWAIVIGTCYLPA